MDVKRSRFQKVRGPIALEAVGPTDPVEMIVKVKEADYVPSGVKVRARIDSTMFTGEGASDVLAQLESDPKVKSVSVSRPLKIIE